MKPLKVSGVNYTVLVQYCDINNDTISIKSIGEQYKIFLYKYATVEIDNSQKSILYFAIDYNHFISTFFNIPFSILCLLNGQCLLHTSALLYQNFLVAFCASQGTGKSTLCSLLNDDRYKLFSDDTLSVDLHFIGHQGSGTIKLTTETLNSFGFSGKEIYININGKHCFLINSEYEISYPIKQLYLFERNDCEFRYKKITSNDTKKMLLYDHVVGIKYFNTTLLHMVMKFIEKCEIDLIEMFSLVIPNNIEQLPDTLKIIKKFIK